MKELILELKKKYDYIILDTPPVGLVSDALELSQFADVLYTCNGNHSNINIDSDFIFNLLSFIK